MCYWVIIDQFCGIQTTVDMKQGLFLVTSLLNLQIHVCHDKGKVLIDLQTSLKIQRKFCIEHNTVQFS